MRFESMFENTRALWVKYSAYTYREGKDSRLFIMPAPKAQVGNIYNPLKDCDALVVDALNAGLLCMKQAGEEAEKKVVLDFVSSYGLIGFMTALPTTPDFMDFDTVYLPKNQYIEEATMPRMEYMEQFYPFEKLDIVENEQGDVKWDVEDKKMMALQMTMTGLPLAANMTYHKAYAEPYEWVRNQLKDWAFILLTSIFYYEDNTDETTRELYRRGLNAFANFAPGYHIIMAEEGPTIVWDFQSLLRTVQMVFSYALTDRERPLRVCRHCTKAFIASRADNAYCSPKCKDAAKDKRKGKEK